MIFSKPIVRILFGRGAFGEDAIVMTSNVLFFYALGMFGFGLREILSRSFYSLHKTKIPMINAIIAIIALIIGIFVLCKE